MRVLMSTDAVGGVWTFTAELRAELAASGVEVVLATLGPQPPPAPDELWLDCRLEWQDDPWDDVLRSGGWLRELAQATQADIVHLNGYAHGALQWDVPVVITAHSCVLSWHEAVRGAPAGPAWARYHDAVAAGMRHADAVVTPTTAMRGALRRNYGLARRCRVIPNGVSAHPAERAPREPFVLGAGRLWDEAKGLDTLDAAAEGLGWRVQVAGAAGDQVAQHVELLGQMQRRALRERMGRAAIFAHPARYEPFGLVVLEAALAGCALVLGDIASLREQWDGAALFVAPGDSAALHAGLQRLIDDPQLRRALAHRALHRAEQRHAYAMAHRYSALYARLCEPRWVAA
jgi:glycosyltransferase involved in cell wall biosynthesis